MRFCISSLSLLRRSRLTFRKRSNSVSTGCGAERAETLGVAGLDFFDCGDDEGTTSGTVVRVEEVAGSEVGTGSWMMGEETGSMSAAVEELGSAAGAEVETAVGIEEMEEESVTTTCGADTGIGCTIGDTAAETNTGAGSNCCTCGTLDSGICEAGIGSSENCMICKESSLLGSCFSRRHSMLESIVG